MLLTTPQAVATADVRKELNFCVKTAIPVLGVVENMAGFVCPHCSECTNIFSKGGGEVMARQFGVPFLGSVPLDPQFVRLLEEGRSPVYPVGTQVAGRQLDLAGGREADQGLVHKYTKCSLCPIFARMTRDLVARIESRDESATAAGRPS